MDNKTQVTPIGKRNDYTWSHKPSALDFGIGQAFFNDIGKTGYSDGSKWYVPGWGESANLTTGIKVWDANVKTSTLVNNTPGTGAVISNDSDGYIRLVQNSGMSVQSTIGFDTTSFALEDTTILGILFKINKPGLIVSNAIYVTTQASNYTGFLNKQPLVKAVDASQLESGGVIYLSLTGAYLDTSVGGDGSIRSGTSTIDRMKIVFTCHSGADISLIGIIIDPVIKPMLPIIFDDAHKSQYTEAFTYMSKKGLKGTIALVGSLVGGANSMTLAQAQEMYAAGWDFINHNYTHTPVNTGSTYGGSGSTNQIALAQTVTAGNSFNLNGAIGSGYFDAPRCLVFFNSGNDANVQFLIRGIDENNDDITVTEVGRNQLTYVMGTTVWKKITSIIAVQNTGNNVTVGTTMSYTEIYSLVNTNKLYLANNGFARGANCYIPPSGQTNALLYRVLKNLDYTIVRGVESKPNCYPFIAPNPLKIPAIGDKITSGDSATLIAVKDEVIAQWSAKPIYLHQIVSGTPGAIQASITDFRLVIDSIANDVKAGNLICPTLSEFGAMCGYD